MTKEFYQIHHTTALVLVLDRIEILLMYKLYALAQGLSFPLVVLCKSLLQDLLLERLFSCPFDE